MKRLRWFLILAFLLVASAPALPSQPADGPERLSWQPGQDATEIPGSWDFHLGDNSAWASPTLDTSTWEHLSGDKPWGAQGHFAYAGYAWYRKRLQASDAEPLAVLLPAMDDAYEVYWNGEKIGQVGGMPPHDSWAAYPRSHAFTLGQASSGLLALRVWRAPLISFDSGLGGGLTAAPILGSPQVIQLLEEDAAYKTLRNSQFSIGLTLFYAVVGLASFIGWLRRREQMLPLWLAAFSLASVLQAGWWHRLLEFSYRQEALSASVHQPLLDIATWFLLLHLFGLRSNPRLMRWTFRLVWFEIALLALDAIAVVFWASGWPQILDLIVSEVILLPELFPVVLVLLALRKRLPITTWFVAIFALCTDLILEVGAFLSQGQRFTHWSVWLKFLRPIAFIHGNGIAPQQIAATLLLISLIVAVYRQTVRDSERQIAIEREFHSAQELQKVLIPEELPLLPGYAVTSAYRPAQEVGGDFFQLIPEPGGSALLILGDVSGKGLTAAMAVALIIGTIRTLAEQIPEPAAMLAGVNRRLHGRLRGGFATCIVLRLHPDGAFTIATAGHPSPFRNGQELDLPPALPLGLSLDAEFEAIRGALEVGEKLTVFSDGVLEARNPAGELFGFNRLQHLCGSAPDATQAAEAAIRFGQDDDITVVTVTRLGLGAAARTSLTAPQLVVS